MSAGRRSALLTQLSEGNPELSAAPQPDPKAKFLTCDCCERFITFVYFKNIPSKDGSSAFALGELDICFPCQKRFNSSEEGLLLKQDDGSKPLPVTKAGTSLYFMGRAPLPPKACLSSGQRATVDPDEENPSDETQTWDMTEASPFKTQIGQVAVESPKKPRASSTKKKASPKRRSTSAAAKKTATSSDKKAVAEAEEDEVPPKSDASPRIGRPRSSKAESAGEDQQRAKASPSGRAKRDRPSSANSSSKDSASNKKEDEPSPATAPAPAPVPAADTDSGNKKKQKKEPKAKASKKTDAPEADDIPPLRKRHNAPKSPGVDEFVDSLSRGMRRGTRPVPSAKKSLTPFSVKEGSLPQVVSWGQHRPLEGLCELGVHAYIARAPLTEEGDMLGCHAIPSQQLWWSTIQTSRTDNFLLTDIWGPTSHSDSTPQWRFSISCGKERIVGCEWFPHVPAAYSSKKNFLGVVTFLRPTTIHMAVVSKDPLQPPAVDLPATGLPPIDEPRVYSTDVCCVFDLGQLNVEADSTPVRLKWLLADEASGTVARDQVVQAALIYANGTVFILGTKLLGSGKVGLTLRQKLDTTKLCEGRPGGGSPVYCRTMCATGPLGGEETLVIARDSKIGLFEIPSCKCLAVLEKEAEVTAIAIHQGLLMQGTIDGEIARAVAPWDKGVAEVPNFAPIKGDYVLNFFAPNRSNNKMVFVLNSHRLLVQEDGGARKMAALIHQKEEHQGGPVVALEVNGAASNEDEESRTFEFTKFVNGGEPDSPLGNTLAMSDVVSGVMVIVRLAA